MNLSMRRRLSVRKEHFVQVSDRPTLSIPDLRAAVSGRVIAPGDAEYDKARQVLPGGIDRHPAVIVRVADARDVAHVIGLARDTGIELAVRSGGHSASGFGVTEGGIVIDVRDLRSLDIDVDGRTAWAGAGLTAAEYSTAVAAHGLATGFGDTGSVGIGGLTTGGGIGYLVRKFGMTIDALLAVDIVTADGELVLADADHHPDLFWAIRGGGGNFGVVTRFKFRLDEVPQIVGGMLLLPATTETITGFIAAAEAAPEELSTIANVMPIPPMPFVPEDKHGKLGIMALMCYAGDVEAGQQALAPFRALGEPFADLLHPSPYPEIYPPESDEYHPLAVARTMFIDRVDPDVAATLLEHIRASTAQMAVAQLRVLGGAMARVPSDATAFAHRKSRILVNLAAIYGSPDEKPAHEAWVDAFVDAVRQDDRGAYVNFVGDEGEGGVHAAYPDATWRRLAEIKRRYDPENLFHLNQNIPPA
jgi:FAD/FMN-containing dehydrogenase